MKKKGKTLAFPSSWIKREKAKLPQKRTQQMVLFGDDPTIKKIANKNYTFYSGATKESLNTFMEFGRVGGRFSVVALKKQKRYFEDVRYEIWRTKH